MKIFVLILLFLSSAYSFANCQVKYQYFVNHYNSYVDSWNELSNFLSVPQTASAFHGKYIQFQKSGKDIKFEAKDFAQACRSLIEYNNQVQSLVQVTEKIRVDSGCILIEWHNLALIREIQAKGFATNDEKFKIREILNIYNQRYDKFIQRCSFYHDAYENNVNTIRKEFLNILERY